MIRAYDKAYLEKAQEALGFALDFAVHDCGLSIDDFYDRFLKSPVSTGFARGYPSLIAGRSGIELVYEVLGDAYVSIKPRFTLGRSKEYWAGWAIAYLQWHTGVSFEETNHYLPISHVISMYDAYHEMDILSFVDEAMRIYWEGLGSTRLKLRRLSCKISQKELSESSGVPLRTIQQYEQGQKNINRAAAEVVCSLSKALCCDPWYLLER